MEPTVVMLYPGHSAEDEFPALERVIPSVHLPVLHTWDGPTHHDVEALRKLGSREQLAAAGNEARQYAPDAVIWACTSGSFVFGPDGVYEQASWVADAAGVPASSTSIAFLEALHALAVGEVVVAATYPEAVAAHLIGLLEANGVRVAAYETHDVPTGEDAGLLGRDFVEQMVASAARQGQGAVIVPDTALHTVAFVDDLETRTGRVVLTANQVSAWWGLHLTGWAQRVDGLGRLFRS